MQPIPVLLTGSLLGLACVAGATRADIAPTTASLVIHDVTVISMTGQPPATHRNVFVDGSTITAIVAATTAIPAGASVIEGGSRFLFPGLVDAHVHLRRSDAPQYVADGILTVRNMWGHSGIRPLINDIAANVVVGPAVVSLSPGIDGSPPQWPETELVDDPATAEPLVAGFAADGWKTLKVYQRLSVASFDAVAASARRHGVEFAGHVPTAVSVEHALASGMRSIEHLTGYDWRLSPNHSIGTWGWANVALAGAAPLVAATVASGAWNIPTLGIFVKLAEQHPPDMRQRVVANRRSFVKLLSEAGAHLAAGTDAGIDIIPARGSLLAELREFEAAGLSRDQVLALATRNGGDLLRIAGLGTIAANAPARLLLLDADPTRDLGALQQVRAVVLDGRVYTMTADCPVAVGTEFAPLRFVGVTPGVLACSGGSPERR